MNNLLKKTTGYFVALEDEALKIKKALEDEAIKKEQIVKIGRNGIFYDQKELKKCIKNKQVKNAYMIEISVSPKHIVNCSDQKFGVTYGKAIPIIAITKIS